MANTSITKLLSKGAAGPKVNIVTITPELAAALLESNTSNRTISRQRIRMYSNAMKRGQWKLNGESIKTCTTASGDVRLLDGQHRLLACIESGTDFQTLVVEELDESVFSVIDRGKARGNHDVMSMAGYKGGSHIAPAVNYFVAEEAGMNPRNPDHMMLVTGEDVVQYMKNHEEEVTWGYQLGQRVYSNIGGSRTAWIVFSVLVARSRGERSTVEAFMDAMAKGEALVSGDPRLAVRNWVIRSGGARTSPPVGEYVATLIRYFNNWVEGRTGTIVRPWTPTAEWPKVSTAQPVYGIYL